METREQALRELEQSTQELRAAREKRDRGIVAATRAGASRRQVAAAAGYRTVSQVQAILKAKGALVISVLALVLLAAVPASASTTISNPSEVKAAYLYERWTAESQLRTPKIAIRIEERYCDERNALACYDWTNRVLVIPDFSYLFTDPNSTSDRRLDSWRLGYRLTWLHELGHARDHLFAELHPNARPRPYRKRFARALGISNYRGLWWIAKGLNEWFAAAYSYCAVDRVGLLQPPLEFIDGYDYNPTVKQHRRVCRVLSRPWNR